MLQVKGPFTKLAAEPPLVAEVDVLVKTRELVDVGTTIPSVKVSVLLTVTGCVKVIKSLPEAAVLFMVKL